MRNLICFTAICAGILFFASAVGAQTKKTKAKAAPNTAAATTQIVAPKPKSGTNYIGETEKGKARPRNNAVFEPNDANTWRTGGSQSASPRSTSTNSPNNQIFDIFDPSGRSPRNGGTVRQPGSNTPGRSSTQTTKPKVKPTTKGLTGGTVIVSSKTAKASRAKPKPKP